MFKKILIALGIVIVLLIALFTAFMSWIKNPYGLEEERLGPRGEEKLPSISAAPNAKNYLLYSKYTDNDYVIHLPLPNEYIHPSNTTTLISKSYSTSVTMYYPDLNGKFHPDNADIPKCNGYCGGYMRAFIKPNKNDVRVINARTFEQIQLDKLGDESLRQFEELDSEFGLDEHFQIRFPVIEQKSNGKKNATDEYFLKRGPNGELQYMFECSPYSPSPGCSVKFNLSSYPELLVEITFGRHLMKNWEDIIRTTNKKITSWGLARIKTLAN